MRFSRKHLKPGEDPNIDPTNNFFYEIIVLVGLLTIILYLNELEKQTIEQSKTLERIEVKISGCIDTK